ncbi:MAG: class I SAM-dependent methyltransferase [Acidobacteria bacterium]|nr:MAG: class I SAM-dependent methyltransferase [Verrucomicrobiota bacterium]PYX15404.1 MAG: class I SAM-dependent methyltransferase [Acidobacteriota bacterium]
MNNDSKKLWIPKGDPKLLYDFLPGDTSRQTHALREALRALDQLAPFDRAITLLDLGCGAGSSYDAFCTSERAIRWIGLDILDSQEVILRPKRNLPFCAYNGVQVPLADQSVDIVYSRQVFEHVRHPKVLIEEIHRVLKKDGFFVGSTSHLEPFHSRSYWNYTPYGFCELLRDAGFRSILVRPGIDSLTLIGRRWLHYLRLDALFEPFFTVESPANLFLEAALRVLRQPTERRNAFKLLFAGQFCFFARKHSDHELVVHKPEGATMLGSESR